MSPELARERNRSSLPGAFRLSRIAAELTFEAVEDSIDEALRVRVGKLLREIDRLVDRNHRWDVFAVNHLKHREAQNREVDLGNSIEFPVMGERLDLAVDFFAMLNHAMDQLLAKR